MANRVQIALPEEDYAALSKLAEEEDRTIAGQARHLLRRVLGRILIDDGEDLLRYTRVPVTGNGDDLSSPNTALRVACEVCQAPAGAYHFEGCRNFTPLEALREPQSEA